MEKITIKKEQVVSLMDKKFIRVFDLQYQEGKHYFDATRRDIDHLVAIKSEEEFKQMKPDATSCVVIIQGEEPKLLLSYEYRYPAGQYLLSVPAGLMDEGDTSVLECAKREIKEECGLAVDEKNMHVINPLLFSTPGMSDESNALVCVLVDDISHLDQTGAQGSELFNGFELVSRQEAKEILKNGVDKNGFFYSIFTWAGLMYFVSDMWK